MSDSLAALDHHLLDRARAGQSGEPALMLVGSCGSGRTERLRRLQGALGPDRAQYIDFERITTTPERCREAVVSHSPFAAPGTPAAGARGAFDDLLAFLMGATAADGGPATFLLDEVLDVRTFESFPGLRAAQAELARAIGHSRNRFVLGSRFATRARRWAAVAPGRIEVLDVAPLDRAGVQEALGLGAGSEPGDLARSVHALLGGQPGYVRAFACQMQLMRGAGAIDPISALAAALAPDGELAARCRFSYELRLHRARGYGALKAILEVLAEEEPLTLTSIAQRLERTPGSTKDYLFWLQDVDLVVCERKKYRFADPLLRLWVRLNRGPAGPDEDRLVGEVQMFALGRLRDAPREPPPAVPAGAGAGDRARAAGAGGSGIIEID